MGLFDKFRKKDRPRAVVVGLDGVPYTLLQDLKDRGRIPNMASIFEAGYFRQMSVCVPEISSVSWSSFMTGTQSGEHGIFGFIDLVPGTYDMYFTNFTHLKTPTLWDDLAANDKKTVVSNMPGTYPARNINGVLISGFVAVDLNKAVSPHSFVPLLTEMRYRIDLNTTKARQNHEFLFKDLAEILGARERVVEFLWKEVDWDLFIVVITGTDRLMHFLWDAYENEKHPYHQDFLNYFGKIDAFVGRVYDRFAALDGSQDQRNQFYMLSDHGFTKIKTEVYLNRWLEKNGYLRFNKDYPETIMDIGTGSTAFVLDPGRLYINMKGKYPLGTVDPTAYQRIREELKEGLENIKFEDGQQIIKKIFFKEELYQGPYVHRGPDLVLLPNPGYDMKGRVNSDLIFTRTDLTGMHTQDDAFFYNSIDNECGSIFEVKKMILKTLGFCSRAI